MQIIDIYDYYNEDIGMYLIKRMLTNDELEDLEHTLVVAQTNADPTEIDVVHNAVISWLETKNLHSMQYKYERIDMPFKKWE